MIQRNSSPCGDVFNWKIRLRRDIPAHQVVAAALTQDDVAFPTQSWGKINACGPEALQGLGC